MKFLRFLARFSFGVLVSLFLFAISTIIVTFALDNEEITKVQCNQQDKTEEFKIIFVQKEITQYTVTNYCNHYNVTITLQDNINKEETKGLLMRLCLIKQRQNITEQIQVFTKHSSINYICYINDGELIIANK